MDLSTSVQFLSGVGPARARALARLGVHDVRDLLWHVPRAYADRSRIVPLDRLVPGAEHTVIAEVVGARLNRRPGRISVFEVELADPDGRGRASAVWFNQPYLYKIIREGALLLLHGRVRVFRGLQFQAPEYEILERSSAEGALHGGRIVPIYPLTAGVTQKQMRRWTRHALDAILPSLDDPLPPQTVARYPMPGLGWALRAIHYPESSEESQRARDRLAFDEFLLLQLAYGLVRRGRDQPGTARPLRGDGSLVEPFVSGLPFALTGGQAEVLAEIERDLASDRPMNRLLQGDVGSGKTVVAAVAALRALEAGAQVAYMAPTEILAQQQFDSFARWLAPLGRSAAVLLGRTRAAERKDVLARLAAGTLDIVIGTHALIEDAVGFSRLGLVIVDEQHRFGVMQRGRLREKGTWPHCLVMSATPIPRTLSLTVYGDLDLSLLSEMPPGRRPPKSRLVPPHKHDDMLRFVAERVRAGERAYFVYPLVEESEQLDLKDATNTARELARHPAFASIKVGLLHGRLKGPDKEQVLARFRDGTRPVLVSTTVIEVGVDVPEATLMIVEHPERFGLSQLHQLRGRVGRGGGESHFFMVGPPRVAPESLERLRVLVRESSGFRVAEEDLRLRGPGDLLGTAQHGLPTLRVGDLVRDPELLVHARQEAERILETDAPLRRPEHARLRQAVLREFGERLLLFEVG